MIYRVPNDEDLGAYIDGELSPHERAWVAEAVAADPSLAERVAALAKLKSVVAGIANERAMTLGDLGIVTPWHQRALPRIAASVAAVIVVAGLAIGGYHLWAAHNADAWLARAERRHLAWLREPLPQSAERNITALVRTALRRLDVPAHAPDMRGAKLTLSDIAHFTDYTGDTMRALQLRYTGQRGCRVSLFVSIDGAPLESALSTIEDGSTRGYYWRVGTVGYALFATGMDQKRLNLLAQNVYQTTRENRDPPAPQQRQLRVATDAAAPCRA